MELKEAITDRILALCQQRGISVNKLCNMSGVTQSTVNNIINRKNNTTTVSTIKKLCDGLDITLGNFSPPRSLTGWSRRCGEVL